MWSHIFLVSVLRETLGLYFLSSHVTVHAGLFCNLGKIQCWLFSSGICSYLFVELFPLCYIYIQRLVVGVEAVSQVSLLWDSSFDIHHQLHINKGQTSMSSEFIQPQWIILPQMWPFVHKHRLHKTRNHYFILWNLCIYLPDIIY